MQDEDPNALSGATEICERCGHRLPPVASDEYVHAVEAIEHDDGTVAAVHSACLTDGEMDALDEELGGES